MKTELQEMTEVEIKDKTNRRIRDLGWANGWNKTPPLVRDCRHEPADVSLGSCIHQVTCLECGFTYKYDSGDCGT